jgi:hypothetical protein
MSIRRCTHRVGSSSCQHCEPAEQPPEVRKCPHGNKLTTYCGSCDDDGWHAAAKQNALAQSPDCEPQEGASRDVAPSTPAEHAPEEEHPLEKTAEMMGAHLIDGEFQSDKYPTTPRDKVPLSVKDVTAQLPAASPVQPSVKGKKLRDARDREIKTEVAKKLAQKRAQRAGRSAVEPPRYDEVFLKGIVWLDDLAGEEIEGGTGEEVFECFVDDKP